MHDELDDAAFAEDDAWAARRPAYVQLWQAVLAYGGEHADSGSRALFDDDEGPLDGPMGW